MIYAVITDELGLFGAAALLLTYLMLVRARLQGGDPGARLVLEAAGHRALARSSRSRCS